MTKEEELFNNNIRIAYKVANKYRRNYLEEFEDIKQIALMGLWKACQTYNEKYQFSTYAFAVVQNNINYYIRHVKKHREHCTSFNNCFTPNDDGDIPFEELIGDDHDYIEEAMSKANVKNAFDRIYMTEKEKRVLYLRMNNKSQNYIANTMNLSQPQISRIQKKLRNKINKILDLEAV